MLVKVSEFVGFFYLFWGVATRADKGWAVKRAVRSSFNVMRSRTGTSALSALPVRLKAGEIFLFANRKSYFLSVISGYSVK